MDIKQTLNDRLGNASDTLKEKVVQIQFEKELDKRANAVIQGLAKLETLNKDLKKLVEKPDVQTFDVDGKDVQKAFTKSAVDEIKRVREAVGKQEAALSDALERNNFDKLFNSQN